LAQDAAMAAVVTLLDVAAERRGAALLDRRHHPPLGGGEDGARRVAHGGTVAAEHVRHCGAWSYGVHRRLYRSAADAGVSPGRGRRSRGLRVAHAPRGDLQVALRGGESAMAEQQLNGPHVRAGFEQVDGERVAQGMGRDRFLQATAAVGALAGPLDGHVRDVTVGSVAGNEPVRGSPQPPPLP
jgi:hypothetical protein